MEKDIMTGGVLDIYLLDETLFNDELKRVSQSTLPMMVIGGTSMFIFMLLTMLIGQSALLTTFRIYEFINYLKRE